MLRGERRLDIQWTSLEVLRDDAALRSIPHPQREPRRVRVHAPLPYDRCTSTFHLNIYEKGELKQQ